MASLSDLLAMIPAGPEYDLLRWTIKRVSNTFASVTFSASRVQKWVDEIARGDGRDASQIRSDILRVMVGQDLIMRAWDLTEEEADAVISGETSMASLGEAQAVAGQKLMNLGGTPEVWKVGSKTYIVYVIPGSEPPIFMSWEVTSQATLQSYFGPDKPIKYDRQISDAQYQALGVVNFGDSLELANYDDNPFLTWAATMEIEAQSQPWIMDEDYQRLIAMAILEDRQLSDAEIESTEWWRSHNADERRWMKLFNGDPEAAQAELDDNRIRTLQMLNDAGMENPSEALVNYMADQVTMGHWSTTVFQQQVTAITDPYSGIEIDAGLSEYLGETEGEEEMGVTNEGELDVRQLARRWLGPVHGLWTDEQIEVWAGKIRNDPDARDELVRHLQQQRLALFPEYGDESLTYEDIAAPWRSFATNLWGQQMDESSEIFATMLKNNDSTENGKLLRREGLARGIGKVVDTAQSSIFQSVGGTLRTALQ